MDEEVGRRGRAGPVIRVAADGVLVAVAWLLLAADPTGQDLAAAVVAGAAASWGGARLRRAVGHRPDGIATWLPLVPAATVAMVRDSWLVSRALLVGLVRGRLPAGELHELPFEFGGDGDATRRTVATFLTTLQPNTYLVGFDADAGTALVHVLVPAEAPAVPLAVERRP